MKLRIAHVDHPHRMAGKFIVQRRVVGITLTSFWMWVDMYYNKTADKLEEEAVLGMGGIIKAEFDDLNLAMALARRHAFPTERKILQTWEVKP